MPNIKAGGRIIFCGHVPYDSINSNEILNQLFFLNLLHNGHKVVTVVVTLFVTFKVKMLLHKWLTFLFN